MVNFHAEVECDFCGEIEAVEVTEMASTEDSPLVGVEETDLPEGWSMSACPKCREELGDD